LSYLFNKPSFLLSSGYLNKKIVFDPNRILSR
jgi:hypothetical protein